MKPTIKKLYAICRAVKSAISDEYRAFEDDTIPGIQLTVGCNDAGEWDYQTGDNSYSGGAYHYPYWSVVGVYRCSNCRQLAKKIKTELEEMMANSNKT